MRPTSVPILEPKVTLPADDRIPGLSQLFDAQWAWRAYCTEFGEPEEPPQRIRAQHFTYRPGTRALVSYVAQWQRGRWVEEDQFAAELAAGRPVAMFRYPDDPHLPGLPSAASPAEAHQLLDRHVSISAQRLRVEVMRYRPGTRAVLRYTASWRQRRLGRVTFFVRVMPARRVARLLEAAELVGQSRFNLPRIAGCWKEGGVVWMTGVPGETVRAHIQKGTAPNPGLILDGLDQLWSTRVESGKGRPLDLPGGFKMTADLLSHLLRNEEKRQLLHQVLDVLGPFSDGWRPSSLAHNDFHDDQMLLTPEGQLALVDFEEAGPGDPLLDVANMLAHLRWMARFGNEPGNCDAYHRQFRADALSRFGLDPQALDLREAFVLFRLSSGPIRQLRSNWAKRVEIGLALALDVAKGRS